MTLLCTYLYVAGGVLAWDQIADSKPGVRLGMVLALWPILLPLGALLDGFEWLRDAWSDWRARR